MSIGRDFKNMLGSVAPGIATALGGPLAGIALKFLADKFTDGDTGKIEDFLLSSDPKVLAELKAADKEFQVKMKQLDVDLEQIYYQDRTSARSLASDRGAHFQSILSIVYTVAYFATLFSFIYGIVTVDPEYVGLVQGLLGILTAAQVQILNFWFGSSRGSKEKSEMLAGAANVVS